MLALRRLGCLLVARFSMLAVIVTATPAFADITIDNFDEVGAPDPWPITRTTVGSTSVTESGLTPTNTIGGVRNSSITGDSFAVPGLDNVTGTVAPFPVGLFDFATSAGADGSVEFVFDGGGGPGGLGANLAGESGILIDFVLFDHAGGVDLPITVSLDDGANPIASLTQMLTSPGAQQIVFGFDDFSNIGTLDLTSIDSLSLFFDAQLAHDFRIDLIGTTSQVPEPASLAVWSAMGILGLVAHRRRAKAQRRR